MPRHRYSEPADLFRAQAALMRWVREAGHQNYLHKGDIGHRLYNNCHGYDKAELFRYWLDDAGELAAFAIFSPHRATFELQVAPSFYCSTDHARLFEYCERETFRLAKLLGRRFDTLSVEAAAGDAATIRFIEARGYTRDKRFFTMTRHDLKKLPEAGLPAGFQFHEATASDLERLADLHNHTFTDKWNADSYRAVFQAPHMEYEWVVVAPDGRFAAFTNLWIDEINRSLLFEPVGTHSDFRRLGLGKALMVYALRRLQAEKGIVCAYVCHEPADKNPASGALYSSVGFKPLYHFDAYAKSVGAPG